ncbi:hypothetical protein BTM25_47480 [Actinomadura rubteroloni]|uniref:Uncharacterized protein n=1 Tax=Actinomadura rubteroloni TaxID=1926885 RepID=A0A2P4UEW1_9ACTN|nr:hypothetical protein [Actinomadura rubteroloni]POM23593.1 hypothetical protein BTM25_47480 [Actinomadura rubteroloni]
MTGTRFGPAGRLRRLIGTRSRFAVAGTALVVGSLSLASAQISPAHQTPDVPGGYRSWAALYAFQARLDKEAARVQSVPGQNASDGLAGVVADPDAHALTVYWHGARPVALRAVLAKARVPVTVRTAPYTAARLQSAADRVVARVRRQPASMVTSVAKLPDGTGLKVGISGTRADAGRVRRELGDPAVPLTIVPGTQAQQVMAGSRWNDLTAGGSLMVAPVCTLAFAIRRAGQAQMLTAHHCFGVGDTNYRYDTNDSGQAGNRFGVLDSPTFVRNGATVDAAAIRNLSKNAFQPYVWRGTNGSASGDGQFKAKVVGAATPQIGNYVCTSGSRSGEICNIKVVERVDTYLASFGTDGKKTLYGPGWTGQQKTSGKSSAGRGDSGGPVYLDNQSSPGSGPPSGGVTAVGVISAGSVSKPCQGVQNRFCFRNVTFVGIDDALHALDNAAIITTNGDKTFPAGTRPGTVARPTYPVHEELVDAGGLSIDVSGNNIVATTDLNAPGDEWVFTDAGDGWTNIRSSLGTGALADADDAGNLIPDSYKWKFTDLGDGWTQIVNFDGRCVSTKTLGHQAAACDASDPAQRFQVVEVESDDHDPATPVPGYTPGSKL